MVAVESGHSDEKLAVVGGLGLVTPLGNDEHTFWRRLINGEHGIKPVNFPEYPHSRVKIGGVVENFGEEDWERLLVNGNIVDPGDQGWYHVSTWAALEVARQVWEPFTVWEEEDGLMVPRLDSRFNPDRIGLVIASEGGGTVDETIKTYERIMSRDRNAMKLGLKEDMKDLLEQAVIRGSMSDMETLAEELAAVADRVIYDRDRFRLNLRAETESIIIGLVDTPLGAIMRAWKIHGRSKGVFSACASGEDAIDEAAMMLRDPQSKLDGVLVIGTEFSNNITLRSQFEEPGALSKNSDPDRAPRPFDKDADGFVIGNMAGGFFMTPEGFAKANNLQPRAYYLGSGAYDEAYSMTDPLPDGEGTFRAYDQLLDKTVMGRTIRYIRERAKFWVKAHGTGTKGDRLEARGIKRALATLKRTFAGFGSIKGGLGHGLSAVAAVEAVLGIKVLEERIMPPNIKCDDPIDEVRDMPLIREATEDKDLEGVDTLSNGFGGHQRGSSWQSAKSIF